MDSKKLKKKLTIENEDLLSISKNLNDENSEVYNVDSYTSKTQLEHILDLPDTYIGSIERYDRDSLIYDFTTKNIVYKKIRQPEGLERIFLEVASNAGDNVQRSRESNVNYGNVVFKFTDKSVEVINSGNMIPIDKNTEGIWIPELIFGTFLTSSNYNQNEEKRVCGRNGLGAKLCNAWSTLFSIHIFNAVQGKEYYQEWKNNMTIKSEPIVKPYSKKTNMMCVKFEPDFERIFRPDKLTPQSSFSLEDIQIFMKHCIDMAFSCNVKVVMEANCPLLEIIYNETISPGINSYIKHIFPNEKNIIYENDFVECAIVDVSEESVHEKLLNISFVNGIITKTGTHISALNSKVGFAIIDCLSSNNFIKDADKFISKLKPKDITSHISIISSFRLVNPKFSSQTKENLTSPIPAFTLKPDYFLSIKKWKLINHIMNTIENKLEKDMLKTDGKKKKHIKLESLEDANWAGSSRSKDCTLYLVEGKSAMSYAVKYISFTQQGRNSQGVLPLRGKPLNAINASISEISSNSIFTDIKTTLGLREGIDYNIDENFNTLRYGKIVILTDADNDGKHIAGLILAYFHSRFKSLLEKGCIFMLRTPIIRIKKGNMHNFFYSERAVTEQDMKNGVVSYFKGLGSADDDDIKRDVLQSKVVPMDLDEKSSLSLVLAFDENNSDDRKPWITNRISISNSNKINIEDINPYPISLFINEEVVEYSIENLQRAIPSFIDGLKDSQRKALYGGFKKFKKNTPTLKVAQFAGMISSITDYKHGEKSMEDTIVGMAKSYTGSNNLAYFSEDGQFGTRNLSGKDRASSRYIFTNLRNWVFDCYIEQDFEILEHIYVNGEKCEYKNFLPIIPMHLVNGCAGVGTGFSTNIPNYNPYDIIKWLSTRIKKGVPLDKNEVIIKPWYAGFKGEIVLNTDKSKFTTKGNLRREKDSWIIDEIPITISIHNYKNYLDNLIENKYISDYSNLSKPNSPYFVIKSQELMDEKQLNLISNHSTNNMVLLDENYYPLIFSNIYEILEKWYIYRLEMYKKRKDNIIEKYKNEISNLVNKITFIELVLKGEILIFKQKKEDILKSMRKNNINEELIKISMYSFSEEEIELINQQKNNKQKELDELIRTEPQYIWQNELINLIHSLNNYYKQVFEENIIEHKSTPKSTLLTKRRAVVK